MSSDNYLDGQIVFPQQKKRDELVNETNFEAIPLQTYGVQQNQFIVVQEKTPEPGICFTWGGTHYKTFDGRVFRYIINYLSKMLLKFNVSALNLTVPIC